MPSVYRNRPAMRQLYSPILPNTLHGNVVTLCGIHCNLQGSFELQRLPQDKVIFLFLICGKSSATCWVYLDQCQLYNWCISAWTCVGGLRLRKGIKYWHAPLPPTLPLPDLELPFFPVLCPVHLPLCPFCIPPFLFTDLLVLVGILHPLAHWFSCSLLVVVARHHLIL